MCSSVFTSASTADNISSKLFSSFFFSGRIKEYSSLIRLYISFQSTQPYQAIQLVQFGHHQSVLQIFHCLSNQHPVLFQLHHICSVPSEWRLNDIMSHLTRLVQLIFSNIALQSIALILSRVSSFHIACLSCCSFLIAFCFFSDALSVSGNALSICSSV